MPRVATLLLIAFLSAAAAVPPAVAAGAREGRTLPGPVPARVVAVLDGDTVRAQALVWPGHMVEVDVRVRGIDAPEMRARCPLEKAAAQRARQALQAIVAGGAVSLRNIGGGKYYGRVLADVETPSGVSVAEALLAHALVRPYGGGRRGGWCR